MGIQRLAPRTVESRAASMRSANALRGVAPITLRILPNVRTMTNVEAKV
jgi:hypothetical protein